MTAPTSREGVKRFVADYQSTTVYRVWVKVKGSWEPCSWLPTFATMTEAELAAIKIAMPTDVRAERSEERAGIEGGVASDTRRARGAIPPPSDLDQHDTRPEGEAVRQVSSRPVCECCGNVLMFGWETLICDECKMELGLPYGIGAPAIIECPIPDERDMDKGEAA